MVFFFPKGSDLSRVIVFDVGNTNVKCVLFEGNKQVGPVQMATVRDQRWEVYREELGQLIPDVGDVEGGAVASVVRGMSDRLQRAVADLWDVSLVEVDTEQGHEARVRLALTLRLPDGSPIWSISLEGKAVTRTSQVKSVVEKMNSALTEVISSARGQLAAALKRWQDESRD